MSLMENIVIEVVNDTEYDLSLMSPPFVVKRGFNLSKPYAVHAHETCTGGTYSGAPVGLVAYQTPDPAYMIVCFFRNQRPPDPWHLHIAILTTRDNPVDKALVDKMNGARFHHHSASQMIEVDGKRRQLSVREVFFGVNPQEVMCVAGKFHW